MIEDYLTRLHTYKTRLQQGRNRERQALGDFFPRIEKERATAQELDANRDLRRPLAEKIATYETAIRELENLFPELAEYIPEE